MIPEFSTREDKLKDRLSRELSGYLYDQLSPSYCLRSGMDFLKGVPIPFTPGDYVRFQDGEELPMAGLADNIIVNLGADIRFKYAPQYKRFLAKFFDEKLVHVVLGKASENLSDENYTKACIYSRAALLLDSEKKDCLYTYACVCRQWYLSLEGEDESQDLVAILKDEANTYFEYTTEVEPDFAPAWYYLGYAYLNQALYAKAQISWKRFVALKDGDEDEAVTEINERLEALATPVRIEEGVNNIIAGRLEAGLRILEPFTETEYNQWWPLHFYLACAYRALGYDAEAIEGFSKVIALAPSNYESTLALAQLYSKAGEDELAEKYARKADLLANGLEQ